MGRLYALLKELGVTGQHAGDLHGRQRAAQRRARHGRQADHARTSISVPLVVRYPGLTPADKPRVVEQMTLTLDFAPSILEICGAAPLAKTHGAS